MLILWDLSISFFELTAEALLTQRKVKELLATIIKYFNIGLTNLALAWAEGY
jgi:hypothetical protein